MNEQTQTQPTIDQLKAAAYDRIAVIEQAQNELKQINDEIIKRIQSTPVVEKKEEEKK